MNKMVSRTAATIGGIAAAVGASLAGAPNAFAGTNGNHVRVHDGAATYCVRIHGKNQYNQYQTFDLFTQNPWTYQGWWWKYYVSFKSYTYFNRSTSHCGGTFRGTHGQKIPKVCPGYVGCYPGTNYGGPNWAVWVYAI